MENTSNIENIEISVSVNRQLFSVFSVRNFTRNNSQITYMYILVAYKIENVAK